MKVTEELEEWEDSRAIGRKRQWFSIEDALNQLLLHKPVQREYLEELRVTKNSNPSTPPSQSPTSASPTSPAAS